MITIENLKVGDIVCTYNVWANSASRREINETKISKIGNKWITVGNLNGLRFDKKRLNGESGGRKLFLGNHEECETYMNELDKRRDIINRIENKLTKLTSEELEEIERKINER